MLFVRCDGIGIPAGFDSSAVSFPSDVARKRMIVRALQGKCLPPHTLEVISAITGKVAMEVLSPYHAGRSKLS